MAKVKVKKRKLSSLFFRILGSLVIPLLLLLGAITVLILRRELETQKRYYRQEARSALESMDKRFRKAAETEPDFWETPERLKAEIARLEQALELGKVDVIDPIRRASIADPLRAVGDEEMANVRAGLGRRREGAPYYVVVDERRQRLSGYLPLRDKLRNRILVATLLYPLSSLKQAFVQTLATLGVMTAAALIVTLLIAIQLTARIIRPIRAINRACREILAGRLGEQVKVRTGDELELMASNFNRMSQALLAVTRQASDSNPLTGLPGNREITAEMYRRLETKEKFVYFHVDIDHFKAYNDRYGLGKGDDVLRRTGEVLAEAIREAEPAASFLGHQGGDDFVMMLDTVSAPKAAERVCKKFDEAIKGFYSKEDYERGYFLAEDSRSQSLSGEAEVKRHPLMSISLAGVSNLRADFFSCDEALERAVPVKKKAKKIPYSKFLIEE